MTRAALAVLCLASLACGGKSPCPPDAPCAPADGGLTVFDCGTGQCTAGQLCAVPASCDEVFEYTSQSAACVDRPAACGDPATQCRCLADSQGDPTRKICCFFAGWKPYSFNICSFACD